MADVNDIVCFGLGGWSSVNSLPTLGFGSGDDVGIVLPQTATYNGHRTWAVARGVAGTHAGREAALHTYASGEVFIAVEPRHSGLA